MTQSTPVETIPYQMHLRLRVKPHYLYMCVSFYYTETKLVTGLHSDQPLVNILPPLASVTTIT